MHHRSNHMPWEQTPETQQPQLALLSRTEWVTSLTTCKKMILYQE